MNFDQRLCNMFFFCTEIQLSSGERLAFRVSKQFVIPSKSGPADGNRLFEGAIRISNFPFTLPETNCFSTPLKIGVWGLYFPFGSLPNFRGYVSFRDGTSHHFPFYFS